MKVRRLRKDDWPNLDALFGAKGACGGCWCQWWRVPRGGKMWQAVQGEPNRRAMKALVTSGKASGILAFDGDTPVGWCAYGRREDFPKLDRTRAYVREDTDGVWSINCFYIARGYRGLGLAEQMAAAAVKAIRARKGRIVEAYPVTLTKDGKRLPATFAYTGPEIVFQRLGFKEVQRLAPTRPLYRLKL
jgi:ribosomal protein S18 acetylase RimI-like enzyme